MSTAPSDYINQLIKYHAYIVCVMNLASIFIYDLDLIVNFLSVSRLSACLLFVLRVLHDVTALI